jgi:HEPN domain-containing protein
LKHRVTKLFFKKEKSLLPKGGRGVVSKEIIGIKSKAVPELHSLRTLIDLCGQVDKEFLRLRSKCSILQPYQHEARYPELPAYNFTQEMADEAIAIATEIYEIVEQKIAQIQ